MTDDDSALKRQLAILREETTAEKDVLLSRLASMTAIQKAQQSQLETLTKEAQSAREIATRAFDDANIAKRGTHVSMHDIDEQRGTLISQVARIERRLADRDKVADEHAKRLESQLADGVKTANQTAYQQDLHFRRRLTVVTIVILFLNPFLSELARAVREYMQVHATVSYKGKVP